MEVLKESEHKKHKDVKTKQEGVYNQVLIILLLVVKVIKVQQVLILMEILQQTPQVMI